jgi:histidine triad (HIT) family protein
MSVALKDRKCIFCPIIKDVNNAVTIIYDGRWNKRWWRRRYLVLQPRDPVTEGHVLVIPYKHVQDARSSKTFARTCGWASEVAKELFPGMDVNISTNQGVLADQSVPHLHVHILPRRAGDGLTNPWTGQEKGHYNTKGKPQHPPDVYSSNNRPMNSAKNMRTHSLPYFCRAVISIRKMTVFKRRTNG